MKKHLRLICELCVNLVFPWLAYTLVRPHYGEFWALIASSLPPMVWNVMELVLHRRVDALGVLVLAGIALSLLAMALGGDARLLLLRESLISGLIGIVFLASLCLRRPLVFYLARATVQRADPLGSDAGFLHWAEQEGARRLLRHITAVWGLGLSTETLIRAWLAWHIAPEHFLAFAPALGYGIAALMGLWTYWYVRQFRNATTSRDPD